MLKYTSPYVACPQLSHTAVPREGQNNCHRSSILLSDEANVVIKELKRKENCPQCITALPDLVKEVLRL